MQQLTHAQIRDARELYTRRGREERGLFLAEGEKVIREALAANLPIRQLIVGREYLAKHPKVAQEYSTDPERVVVTDEASIRRISSMNTPPQLLAAMPILRESTLDNLRPDSSVLALDDIADPGNLGTMIRTAAWFGIETMLLSEQTVDEYNEKVVRSAMGALFRTRIVRSLNLAADLRKLKDQGRLIVVTDVRGSGNREGVRHPYCLVMGSESHGVSPAVRLIADTTYAIPGSGLIESLNVAVSTGIALHDLSTKQG